MIQLKYTIFLYLYLLYFFFKDMSLSEYVNRTNNIYKNFLFLKKEKFKKINNKITIKVINKIDINTSSITSYHNL